MKSLLVLPNSFANGLRILLFCFLVWIGFCPQVSGALIAYEGFSYADASAIPGQTGGTGFANAWQLNGTPAGGALAQAGSLTYTDSTGKSLLTSGQRGFFTGVGGTAQPNRDLAAARGTDGTTTWLSFIGVRGGQTVSAPNIYPRGGNLSLFNNAGERLATGNSSSAPANTWALVPTGTLANRQGSTAPFDQVTMVVVRIDHKPGNDDAFLFINPTLGVEPSVGSAAATSVGAFDFSFNRVRPFAGGPQTGVPFAELQLDEIRVGENYFDVTPFTGAASNSGLVQGVRREVYLSLSGNTVANLTSAANFPSTPDQVDVLSALESTASGVNYGQRLSGILIPPITGNYIFYVASDDQSQLFLSADESPANKTQIASEPVWSNSRDYSGTAGSGSGVAAEKKSQPIALTAGRAYYLEVLHKQGVGGGSLAVAWQKPGDPVPANGSAPIPGGYFSVINRPPTLAGISNPAAILEDAGQQTIALTGISAGSPDQNWQSLTVTATSSNPDLIPNPNVTYTSPNATATLTYTPVPNANGTATITVAVQDNGGTAHGGIASVSKTFTVTVTPVNDPPRGAFMLTPLAISDEAGQQTAILTGITPGPGESSQRLTITAISSNPSLIPNPTVQYTSPQSTATLTYAPTPSRGGAATILVLLNDDGGTGNGGLDSMFGQFTVTVSHINREPTLAAITDQNTAELTELRFTSAATDPNGDTLTFTLDTGAPAGASIDAMSGVFSWTPTEAQGPGTYSITVRVRDNGASNLSASQSFTVIVREVNQAPVIAGVSNQAATQGSQLLVSGMSATDSDSPANRLTWTLGAGAPAGMAIDASTGIIRWTPSDSQAAGTFPVTVRVTDDGTPTLGIEQSFSVVLAARSKPKLAALANMRILATAGIQVVELSGIEAGSTGTLMITGRSSDTSLIPAPAVSYISPQSRGTLSFAPAANRSGKVTLTVTAQDELGAEASQAFEVEIIPSAAKSDFNGDGLPEIIFQDADGFLGVWTLRNTTAVATQFLTPSHVGDPAFRVVGGGHFNGDGNLDLLFQDTQGSLAVWFMRDLAQLEIAPINPSRVLDKDWRVKGVEDFNRDGKPDLLFQHADESLAVWSMDGVNLVQANLLVPNRPDETGWNVGAIGDFNGDQMQDLVFQHQDGRLMIWYLNGHTRAQTTLINPLTTGDVLWRLMGSVDLDQDGMPDLLFQHGSEGPLAVWFMDGTKMRKPEYLNPANAGGTWRAVAPR
jgi:hypothetical protein